MSRSAQHQPDHSPVTSIYPGKMHILTKGEVELSANATVVRVLSLGEDAKLWFSSDKGEGQVMVKKDHAEYFLVDPGCKVSCEGSTGATVYLTEGA